MVTATDVPVLIPRRADGGRRDRIWQLLHGRIWQHHRIVIGTHEHGPFNRAAALNHAAHRAGDWNLAIIADSDSFVPAGQLDGAVQLADRTGRVVIAHSRWVNVDLHETDQLLDEGWLEHRDDRLVLEFTVSSMLVVPRTIWDAVNGFDERFKGWGREDNAFMRAVKILTAPPLRIDGTVYHLAHDRPSEDVDRRNSPLFRANERRWREYISARTPDAMQQIVAGNRATVLA